MADKREKVLVVIQLTGGNDYLNCVVPYENGHYKDARPNLKITDDQVIPLDNGLGLNPGMGPVKDLYDLGKVAIMHGIGYPVPNRSHFRSMDIWHTAEPTKVGVLSVARATEKRTTASVLAARTSARARSGAFG